MTLVQFKNKNADRTASAPSLLGDFFGNFMNEELISKNFFKSSPSVNISETAENFKVELAVPGLEKGDFKVSVEDGILTISAEKQNETNDETSKFTRKEFSYSSFKRSFTLPELVLTDKISAEYTNGVLKLLIPKKEEAKQKAAQEIKIS